MMIITDRLASIQIIAQPDHTVGGKGYAHYICLRGPFDGIDENHPYRDNVDDTEKKQQDIHQPASDFFPFHQYSTSFFFSMTKNARLKISIRNMNMTPTAAE